MMRIDSSLTDGVDPFYVQPTSTAPKKHPMEKVLRGLMIKKESALGRKAIFFFFRSEVKEKSCYLLNNSDTPTDIYFNEHSFATGLAINVFPHPGGP